ncbi:MAG: GatB/YqeY domain-containing protein [Gammaproteobacteria bacterium]|uniref:GatB/YqeY domain-containing protein n=1 Tax=Marinomonas sp. ef1 TaxID=2005043 RepID=UPI000C28AD1D|nr:GatB/YqeY domain-containing protein [Marinomonas sp. ef1]MBU1293661.1 GatB/YqeY domain-containing protein [Gammaproteobacteria bacterium]MBU1465043.1 GatB/YqeY domain-containing protein [Gammaproteobacteria bacterium]MBU2023049.1 GatB/YqeY domain-containing protein [Gammaproteobacteria bacterium]MBU2317562.1 GatB/YqeY domain-containing protein [Gammaproteobacteria bacterium]MBU2414529.1 GatB/YqeY domain-containing protein [Gammaproteobacteria bacterium]
MSELKKFISETLKTAMRAKEKQRVTVIRTILSECKKIEVDERIELDDARVLAVLDKMNKQRKDSNQQFIDGGREDLAAIEQEEMLIISEFLPTPLTDDEVGEIVKAAIAETGATSMQQMGAVMAIVKPQVQGRADMAQISKQVKAQLG